MKSIRGFVEKEMTCDEFEKLFKEKHLSMHYYDGEEKCFYELVEDSKIIASTLGENHLVRTLRHLLFHLGSGSD